MAEKSNCNKADYIKKAEEFCSENNLQYTKPRALVLKVLISHNAPVGAYDIIDMIAAEDKNSRPNPPTIYRALDFWAEYGFIHKVESLNKYIACCNHEPHNHLSILICDQCGDVQEAHGSDTKIDKEITIEASKFTPKNIKTEIHGICGSCNS